MSTEIFFATKEELFIFGCAILLGLFFGIVYDAFRVVRAVFPHKSFMVFLEDFFYMLFCSFCYFIFITELARGRVRLFILIGNLAGFAFEHYTVGNAVVFVLRKIVGGVKKYLLLPVFNVTLKPVARGFRKISMKIPHGIVQNRKRLKKVKKVEKTT